jgi:carbamoyltransferase
MYLGFDAGSNERVDVREVADLLVGRKVVGLVDGPMELGPRALGARSILADPQDADVNQTINERLDRVEYMPFAPVVLEEQAGEVLVGWSREHLSSKHMTLVYQVSPAWRDRLKGVVHVDGTVRPQVIRREDHPFYYAILEAYFKKTGIPVLINTSFNTHGEPILRTVEEGLQALEAGRVDALVVGNRLCVR